MISGGSVSGHFTLLKYNADTGRLVEECDFDNLITDFGLIQFCSSALFDAPRACVGTGTTEPRPEDTTLERFLRRSDTQFWADLTYNVSLNTPQAPDYISTITATARFNAGSFDGDNLTEVGVCPANDSANRVWCRALIVDAQGRPSAITVLNNEYLDVRYTLSFHPDLEDHTFTFVMDGVTYTCTSRYSEASNNVWGVSGGGRPLRREAIGLLYVYNSQTLGEVTGQPIYTSGGRINCISISKTKESWSSSAPYSIFSKQTLGLNNGNFSGGIGAITVGQEYGRVGGMASRTQISIDPKLPKDANTTMTFTFGQTISRWTPPTP